MKRQTKTSHSYGTARMTIEEKVFERKRFIPERMLEYGFRQKASGYVWKANFMNGDFHAIVYVSAEGNVTGSVIDVMNDEEYAQLRMEHLSGSYVSSVRAAYEKILEKLAETCCKQVLFASDQANRIAELILQKYDVQPDFPWAKSQDQNSGTFRHADSRKWFALVMNIKWDSLLKNNNTTTVDVINLKINPADIDTLTQVDGIYPAFHMNHKHWISVVLDNRISDEHIMELVDTSFSLTLTL